MEVHEIVRVAFDELNASIFERSPEVGKRFPEKVG